MMNLSSLTFDWQLDYDGSEHTLIRDEEILLVYKGDELNLAGVEPAWDRLIVKIAKSAAETASGIVVAPTSGGDDRPSEGEVRYQPSSTLFNFDFSKSLSDTLLFAQVVAVGKGRMASNGEVVPMSIKVGEFVKFRDYAGSEVRIEGENYIVVREFECLAKWA